MMKKVYLKKIIAMGLACLCLSSAVATDAFASATTTDDTIMTTEKNDFNENETREFLEENGVPNDKIDVLLEKLENDELWDCYKKENLKDLPKDFNTLDLNEEGSVKYYRFEDGSFIKNEFIKNEDSTYEEIKPGDINLLGTSSSSFGTQYTDYTIKKTQGSITAQFKADFWRARYGYGASEITNAYSGKVKGNYTDGTYDLEDARPKEDLVYHLPAKENLIFPVTHSVSFSGDGVEFTVNSGETVILTLELKNGNMSIFFEED